MTIDHAIVVLFGLGLLGCWLGIQSAYTTIPRWQKILATSFLALFIGLTGYLELTM